MRTTHTKSTVPDTIPRSQYIAALKAFSEAVGLDPANTFVGMYLDGEFIQCQAVVPGPDGNKRLTRGYHGVGNLSSVLAATVRIDVVDD